MEKTIHFFKSLLKLEVQERDVEVAHHLGLKQPGKLRPIIVRCHPHLHHLVLNNSAKLKGLKNDYNEPYYVKKQYPEPINTEKIETQIKVKETKQLNDKVEDESKKVKIEFKGGKLLLNGKIQKKHVYPRTVSQLFNVDENLQDKLNTIRLTQSGTKKDKSSQFTGFAAKVQNITDIRNAYLCLKQLQPDADHLIMAYVTKDHTGGHDHGEHGASRRILQILQDRNSSHTALFVTRVYGGIPLGPKRFLHIEKVAREALNNMQEK